MSTYHLGVLVAAIVVGYAARNVEDRNTRTVVIVLGLGAACFFSTMAASTL